MSWKLMSNTKTCTQMCIHHRQTLEVTKALSRWMDEQTGVIQTVGCDSVIKQMSNRAMKTQGRILTVCYKVKEAYLKRLRSVLFQLGDSGKCKTIKTKKISAARGWGREGWIDRAQSIFKARKLFCTIHNGEYMSLYTCQNPQKAKPKSEP